MGSGQVRMKQEFLIYLSMEGWEDKYEKKGARNGEGMNVNEHVVDTAERVATGWMNMLRQNARLNEC